MYIQIKNREFQMVFFYSNGSDTMKLKYAFIFIDNIIIQIISKNKLSLT